MRGKCLSAIGALTDPSAHSRPSVAVLESQVSDLAQLLAVLQDVFLREGLHEFTPPVASGTEEEGDRALLLFRSM